MKDMIFDKKTFLMTDSGLILLLSDYKACAAEAGDLRYYFAAVSLMRFQPILTPS